MTNRININDFDNVLHFEVRKVQQQRNGRSLMVALPIRYTKKDVVAERRLFEDVSSVSYSC
jgi:hypothetical protein